MRKQIQDLETEISQAKRQIQQLELERDYFRRIAYTTLRERFSERDWEGFNAADFIFTPEEVRAKVSDLKTS